MPAEKTLAIVLRVIEFSETSCVVRLFTRDFGKLSGLAKGARRPKSPFEAALDLLAVCRLVFIHKSSETLDVLTEARLERRFRSASRDLSRLYAGYYVAELLDDLTDENDPHLDLFDIADQTLLALDSNQAVIPTVLRFELTALRILGHLPSLQCCAACGKKVTMHQRVAFGQLAGGVMCSACRVGSKQIVSVRAETIKIMQQFADADSVSWQSIKLDRPTWGEVRGVLNHFLRNLLGHQPRIHDYLGLLAS